jgi:hypothetical protein
MAPRPLWVALAITAIVTALRLTGTVDSDVAWQLWIARQIHGGAGLYHDIIETNPPLWFWMALPVDRVATLLNVRSEAVLIVAIGGLVALSLSATDRLIRHIPSYRRLLVLAYGALTLAALPWMHVGQREQIVLIGTVPYAALIAARREGRPIEPVLAALIGLGAALGFALKHYFLIVPALLELWLLAGARERWRPIRPETAAIFCVGLAYAAAIMLLAGDFLTNVVPLVRLAYGTFGAPSIGYLFGPFTVLGLATLGLVAAHGGSPFGRKAPLAGALLVSALGFAAAYFIQFKGWPYHAIPLVGCASLALAALLAETATPPRFLVYFAPALLLLPLALEAQESTRKGLPTDDLLHAISDLPPGTPVGFITENTAIPWSVTLQHQLGYPSRYNGFWMLGAVHRNELAGSPDPRLTGIGRRIVRETVADYRCMPPRRIVATRPQQGSWNEGSLDLLPVFLRDPDFAELMRHYRTVSRTSVEVYQLASPLPPVARRNCRPGR